MTRDQMIAAAEFVHASFGPDADLDIDDDGSAFITTPHATLEGFFAFDRDDVSRLTLVP
ncbi:hypothetical protein QFZ79_000542 [Arthrobacter sp. V4I6]|uniref:hypothetical protein n=1 Tax=unclassified Arthrobacter TaxID=235627 RepID=UPI0027878382|nr:MULTISPECIES: hypothetical protein [unclassified Arthrobacter]MDQ0822802.1 hypothetical protein [Arthrobacter sp. V1I7]MDQ0852431.1 hypothetical protein [Arthrobacter sp. V4I6]